MRRAAPSRAAPGLATAPRHPPCLSAAGSVPSSRRTSAGLVAVPIRPCRPLLPPRWRLQRPPSPPRQRLHQPLRSHRRGRARFRQSRRHHQRPPRQRHRHQRPPCRPCSTTTASAGGTGITSPDNDDPVSERLWRLCNEAGLARHEVVHWNCVAWAKDQIAVGLERAGRTWDDVQLASWLYVSVLEHEDDPVPEGIRRGVSHALWSSREVVTGLLADFRQPALASFVEAADPEQLDELEALIRRRRDGSTA